MISKSCCDVLWRSAKSFLLASSSSALQLYGLVWSGPSLHYWQQLQERIFKGKRDTGSLVKRVHPSFLTHIIHLQQTM